MLSEYIHLTKVFDGNKNKIRQEQARVFPAVLGRATGLGEKGWGCGSSQAIGAS